MVCIIVLTVSGSFKAMWEPDLIIPGPGVTRQITLSEYFPALAGTPGDTEVYVLEGAGPGGTVLVLGGVHYNEPGASVAAAVLVESATMDKGRLFVIPFTCKSGFTHSDPGEGNPQRFSIETPGGLRTFKYGAGRSIPSVRGLIQRCMSTIHPGRGCRGRRRRTSTGRFLGGPTADSRRG